MQHREPLDSDPLADKVTIDEIASIRPLARHEPQEDDYLLDESERVPDEFVRQFEGRIGDDAGAALRSAPLKEKVDPTLDPRIRASMRDQIRGDDAMACLSQHPRDCASPAAGSQIRAGSGSGHRRRARVASRGVS